MQIERVSLIHSNLAILYKDSQNSLKNIILIVFFFYREWIKLMSCKVIKAYVLRLLLWWWNFMKYSILKREGILCYIYRITIHWEDPRLEFQARKKPGFGSWCRSHGEVLLTGFLLMTCSGCFYSFKKPRPPVQAFIHPQSAPINHFFLHQSLNYLGNKYRLGCL